MKRQPSEWEKIFANEATNNELISKMDKQLIQFNVKKKKKDPVKTWAEDLATYFSKEVIQMAKMHMKRCSASLIIRERQNKTTTRHHLTPLRIKNDAAKTNHEKIYKKINAGEGVEKRTLLTLLVKMEIDAATMKDSMQVL